MPNTGYNNANNYRLYIKLGWLVIIGYLLVIIETIIARAAGLTDISYHNIIILAAIVISGSVIFILLLNYKKSTDTFFIKSMYGVGFFLPYFIAYTAWVYFLNDFRVFALFCSILAITIVLTYFNITQSLIFSIGTIVMYILAAYYGISVLGQKGNIIKELFLALSLIPASIFFAILANQIKKKNEKIEKNEKYLEEMNEKLLGINRKLSQSQESAKIEMDLAYEIQKSLFPGHPKNVKGWDIDMHFKPRYGLSGDFYDFYINDGMLNGLSLFDVSGHGVASALITILAKPVFFRFFNLFKNDDLGRVLEVSEKNLLHDLSEIQMFITGIILRFKDENIEYVNAGHTHLLFKNKETGKVSIVSNDAQSFKTSPIGFLNISSPCKSYKISLVPGDILLLYTDGIIDGENMEQVRYGHERLMKSLEEAPDGSAHEILDFIIERFNSFINENELRDDFTLILLKKIED